MSPKPIIYQMLLRLWGQGRFSSADKATLEYLRSLGVGYVWYTGIPRHARRKNFVKGDPGSPYAVSDWYDVNPYMADDEERRMEEFEALVARTHEAGLRVIIDFVPNHVARDYGSTRARKDVEYLGDGDDESVSQSPDNDFIYFPGQAFVMPAGGEWVEDPARASGNCLTPSPGEYDWYDTVKINYTDSHTRTWDRMYDIVRFWASKGVDGFRLDMVDMVPMDFLKWLIGGIKAEFPGTLFVAETYRKDLYNSYLTYAGFDLLYDKEGMYTYLRAICEANRDGTSPIQDGRASARMLTSNWQELGQMQGGMLNFLENHDEQRLASPFFAGDPRKGIPELYASALFNTAAFMLYFGQELGEDASESADGRTSIFNFVHPGQIGALWEYIHGGKAPGHSRMLLERYRRVLTLAGSPLFSEGQVYDLCYCNLSSPGFDPDRHFAFLRSHDGQKVLIFCNFSSQEAAVTINIPPEAADMTGCRPGLRRLRVKAYDAVIKELK